MYIQLWSSHFAPQPSGIAPVAATIAGELASRGHQVEIVAAHPYYPSREWGTRYRPYRQSGGGLSVYRLPLLGERSSVAGRVMQELSFATALTMTAPLLERPDALVAVSPSFAALAPAMLAARLRQIPWVLWLQDILPDGATASGLVRDGLMVELARRFERLAYREASRVVVISDSFADNIRAKGVPDEKITRIFNPATRTSGRANLAEAKRPVALTMGNIGHTQNLAAVVRAFERSEELRRLDAEFVMAGDGVAGDDVRNAIGTDRVRVTGLLDAASLEQEISRATVAVVSQSYATDAIDFNVPSKLMNFMAAGLPVVAAVRRESEVARIIEHSGAGWVTHDVDGGGFARTLTTVFGDEEERHLRGARGLRYAEQNFAAEVLAKQHESVLRAVSAQVA